MDTRSSGEAISQSAELFFRRPVIFDVSLMQRSLVVLLIWVQKKYKQSFWCFSRIDSTVAVYLNGTLNLS